MDFRRIAVVGAGAWGTALANAASREGRQIYLIARYESHAIAMMASGENSRRLPGAPFAEGVEPTADLASAGDADLVVLATPAQAVREMAARLAPIVKSGAPIVSTAKGIDRETGAYPSESLAAAMPDASLAVLSGPSFAADLARGLPTAVVLASADEALAKRIAAALSSPTFRLYHGADMRGVEIGGAAKNVLAIGAGVVAGAQFGESARAALVARGFAELQRFAAACGARPETLMGLSGLGDVFLSCATSKSRNFAYGEALGRGVSAADAARGGLAEGAFTADILVRLAQEKGVEMPVAEAVAALVAGRITVVDAVRSLMTRPARAEQ